MMLRFTYPHLGPEGAGGSGGGTQPPDSVTKLYEQTAAEVKKIAGQVETFDGRLEKTAAAVAEVTRLVSAATSAMEETRKAMPAQTAGRSGMLSSRPTLATALTRREVVGLADGSRKWASTISANPIVRSEMVGEKLTDWEAEAHTVLAALKGIHEYQMAVPSNDLYRRDPMAGLKEKAPDLVNRMTRLAVNWGGDATEGAEWQTTLFSSTWVDHFTLPAQVQTQFQGPNRVNIPDGSEGFSHPVDTSGMTFATLGNTSGATARVHQTAGWPASPGQPGTGKALHVVALTRGIINMNEDWVQDSVGDQMAHARMVLQRDGALAWDEMLLNGQAAIDDTSHDGTGASAAADGSYNGLRFLCHDGGLTNTHETNGGGGKLTVADVIAEREKMTKFGVNPRDVVIFVDPVNYLSLVHDDAVKTADVYGPQFTLRTGELASLDGMALIPTDQMLTTMNASGDVDTSTSNLTGAILVNTTRGFVGQKRGIELRFVPNPSEYQVQMVAFLRTSFAPWKTDTTDEWIRYIYNLATT